MREGNSQVDTTEDVLETSVCGILVVEFLLTLTIILIARQVLWKEKLEWK